MSVPQSDVIDVHAHLVTAGLADIAESGGTKHGIEFFRDANGRITSSSGGHQKSIAWPTPLETPDQRVAVMDSIDVDVHLLSLSPTMHWYNLGPADGLSLATESNDDMAEMIAAHPTRFKGLGFLPLQDVAASVAEMERCVRELGFVGFQVGTNINGLDWDTDELYPVLQAAQDLNAVMFFHPTRGRGDAFLKKYHLVNFIGNPLETTIAVASLIFGGVMDRLPNLKAVFAHGGGYGCLGIARMDHGKEVRPESRGMELMPSDYLRQMWFDSLVHGHRTLDQVIDFAGIDRVVLGSDYPADMGEPKPVEWLNQHPTLSEADKEKILRANPARLLA
ncbi:MAG: amidohydrolase family protein [Acidimicrobiia bacterium]